MLTWVYFLIKMHVGFTVWRQNTVAGAGLAAHRSQFLTLCFKQDQVT